MSRRHQLVLALAAVVVAGGCTSSQPGVTAPAESCTFCHGSADNFPGDNVKSAAPPMGVHLDGGVGAVSISDRGVGAHQIHLKGGALSTAVACIECHVVPTLDGQPYSAVAAHMNNTRGLPGRADVDFGGRAVLQSVAASYAYDTNRCSAYCHGATLSGGSNTAPVWTKTGEAACGTCHGLPPTANHHPASKQCSTCHPTADDNMQIVRKDLHINGVIDVGGALCTACHGDAARGRGAIDAAPPVDSKGSGDRAGTGVGAHQPHLTSGTISKVVACTECHVVPTDLGHIDGVAATSFTALAVSRGATASWSGTACSNYCHGNTIAGGADKAPSWTNQAGLGACGTSCHTLPPGGAHTASTNCVGCHPTVDAANNIVRKDLHINGVVDLQGGQDCTRCHGTRSTPPDVNDPAPPVDTLGQPGGARVGAHQAHLRAGTWSSVVGCNQCHTVPSDLTHINGQVEVQWGQLADGTLRGQQGTFTVAPPAGAMTDPTTAPTCSNYCHGATIADRGGTPDKSPTWTSQGLGVCGTSCHTLPPGGSHPAATYPADCQNCHQTVDASGSLIQAQRHLHINGQVETTLTCTSCHGTSGRSNNATDAAPPVVAIGGHQAGAHLAHLVNGTWSTVVACAQCHTDQAGNFGHANGTIEVAWGSLATANSTAASPAAGVVAGGGTSCTNWCHGNAAWGQGGSTGSLDTTALWLGAGSIQCGTCHGLPPAKTTSGSNHPASTYPAGCPTCHNLTVNAAGSIIDKTRHINGVVDVAGYHDLAGWQTPRTNPDHHGRYYFLGNQGKDNQGALCTSCHGANLDGVGGTGPSCNSCHANWRTCNYCHGGAGQNNPPSGVYGESTTLTLAVGRHTAHLTASATHNALACTTCHTVPPADDLTHTQQYVPSADLSTTGHHGDVTFAGAASPAAATTWSVNGRTPASGTVTGRGTCLGGCHSDGHGGAPRVTPYWAGGTWTAGGCGNCHADQAGNNPTGEHNKHVNGEGMSCSDCHPDVNASGTAITNLSQHLNGAAYIDVKTAANGILGVITASQSGTKCNTIYNTRCAGTCHGEDHGSGRCW